MTPTPLLTGHRLTLARTASAAALAMVAFGVLLALVTYPSWQVALAFVCVAPCPAIVWFSLPRAIAPFVPGVPAAAYLRSMVPPLVVVGLISLGGWLLSIAPS